eukprot:1157460-Pelagomonas_calceolata.AAC.10
MACKEGQHCNGCRREQIPNFMLPAGTLLNRQARTVLLLLPHPSLLQTLLEGGEFGLFMWRTGKPKWGCAGTCQSAVLQV